MRPGSSGLVTELLVSISRLLGSDRTLFTAEVVSFTTDRRLAILQLTICLSLPFGVESVGFGLLGHSRWVRLW